MKKLALATGLLLSTLGLGSCDAGDFNIPKPKDLKPGGIYVSYVNANCKSGCEQLGRGDLIQSVDGTPVKTNEEFDKIKLTDGQPHKLDVIKDDTQEKKTITINTEQGDLQPLKDIPPLWTVSAEKLNEAPGWARRRMFAHSSPMVMLVNVDGGILDGRQLYGKKRFMMFWDWGTRTEQAEASTFMKVLQKAQADLNAKGVEVMFIHLQFPTNQRQAAMNDSDLRKWMDNMAEKAADGTKLPPLPAYRFPNRTEFNEARQLGMENAYTVFENLGSSPTLVLMDERGIIRWHSEQIQQPAAGAEVSDPVQYTIIEAIKYSLDRL